MSAKRKIELSQQQFESIGRALADPRRYAILQQIASQSGMGCSALEAHHHISAPTISHHLKELQESGLIEIVREGRTACLSLRREIWESYLHRLAKL
jgi:ArsR family transcriptional regulator